MDSRCLVLTVVPRRGHQRCTNYISVFIFVRHVFMSSLLIKPSVQHHRSRVSPVQPRYFPPLLWGNLTVKDPTQHRGTDTTTRIVEKVLPKFFRNPLRETVDISPDWPRCCAVSGLEPICRCLICSDVVVFFPRAVS